MGEKHIVMPGTGDLPWVKRLPAGPEALVHTPSSDEGKNGMLTEKPPGHNWVYRAYFQRPSLQLQLPCPET